MVFPRWVWMHTCPIARLLDVEIMASSGIRTSQLERKYDQSGDKIERKMEVRRGVRENKLSPSPSLTLCASKTSLSRFFPVAFSFPFTLSFYSSSLSLSLALRIPSMLASSDSYSSLAAASLPPLYSSSPVFQYSLTYHRTSLSIPP